MADPYVRLSTKTTQPGRLAARAAAFREVGVDAALEFAKELGRHAPSPGDGATADLWEALATIAAFDLGSARAIEPHLDALAIAQQSGIGDSLDVVDHTWGVFAAEGGDDPLRAVEEGGTWRLSGTKPWCSLAGRLDRALITAHIDDDQRGLFAVNLHDKNVEVVPNAWHARGLVEIPSGPVRLSRVEGGPVGDPGWYLSRPGFAWGGVGVAACWFGGAVGLARTLFAKAGDNPDALLAMHLGAVDVDLQSARRALAEAAEIIDYGGADQEGSVLAKRVRAAVATACESILSHVAHASGPAPLAQDAGHSKRVADLELYLRQHHAEKDLASLGSALSRAAVTPW